MFRARLSLIVADFDVFEDTPQTVTLSERQQALLLAFFSLSFYRQVWTGIDDADWDALENELAAIAEQLTQP